MGVIAVVLVLIVGAALWPLSAGAFLVVLFLFWIFDGLLGAALGGRARTAVRAQARARAQAEAAQAAAWARDRDEIVAKARRADAEEEFRLRLALRQVGLDLPDDAASKFRDWRHGIVTIYTFSAWMRRNHPQLWHAMDRGVYWAQRAA